MKVFIDAGHGGSDYGATGNNLIEKDLNLKVALKLQQILESYGVKTYMSRCIDTYISIQDRANLANIEDVDLVVSIHHNAGGGDGYEIIHSILKNSKGIELAKYIALEFDKLGQNKRRIFSKESNKYPGRDYYGIIRLTKAPAVITEFGFIDTEDHEAFDEDRELYLEALAIANGIAKFLNIDNKDLIISKLKEENYRLKNLLKQINKLSKEV